MFVHDIEGLRVLEVGCGIALASLVLAHRRADITATDRHPQAASFLQKNTVLNHMPAIPFVRTGWEDNTTALGRFDLVIGSDILYDRPHARLLAEFIERHAEESCEVIIVDPGRGIHAQFTRRMTGLGYAAGYRLLADAAGPDSFRGHILHYVRLRRPTRSPVGLEAGG
jgi:predicted nicotinamide N-methyase